MPAQAEEKQRPAPPLTAKALTALGFLLLYVPLAVLVLFSFRGPVGLPGSPQTWTLRWYLKVFSDQQVVDALSMSLWVGLWATLGSTVIGTAAGLALERVRFPGRKLLDTLTHVPLIMPEIVLGLSLLIWFVLLQITLGSFSI